MLTLSVTLSLEVLGAVKEARKEPVTAGEAGATWPAVWKATLGCRDSAATEKLAELSLGLEY